MNFRKNLKRGGGGHFRSEKFHCKFSAGATGLRKMEKLFTDFLFQGLQTPAKKRVQLEFSPQLINESQHLITRCKKTGNKTSMKIYL